MTEYYAEYYVVCNALRTLVTLLMTPHIVPIETLCLKDLTSVAQASTVE